MVMRNKLQVAFLAATLAAGATLSGAVRADAMTEQVFDETRVSGGAMVADILFARPLLVASTVVGSGLFVVAMPFTLVGGTTDDVWDALVATPAEQAFLRCLGCTPVQNQVVRSDREIARQAEEAARNQPQATEQAAAN